MLDLYLNLLNRVNQANRDEVVEELAQLEIIVKLLKARIIKLDGE